MSKRDYYEVLGVSKNSNPDEVKKAYRKIALKFHPDRNPGDKKAEEKFKEATEAYEILSDPQKKAQYDQFGHAAEQMGGMKGNPFGESQSGFTDIFSDVFSDFFGNGGGTRRRQEQGSVGADLRYNMELTFEQAAFGHSTEIEFDRLESCAQCSGTGARSSKDIEVCRVCNGTGRQQIQQGFFSVATTCSNCEGQGKSIKVACSKCHGQKRSKIHKKIKVNIPAGISSGSKIKLSGEGEGGLNGGHSGDLYIVTYVKDHPIFEREDYDIRCQVPISITQATLGSEVEVPTLEGKAKLTIPAGTQNHRVFRLKNKGISHLHGSGRGDQFVKILVEIPTNLNHRQKELLEEFAAISDEQSSPIRQSFLDKLKNLF